MNLVEGKDYWTILPSIESYDHGNRDIREPWVARYEESQSPAGRVGTLHAISNISPNGVDYDSNASAYATSSDARGMIFETESAARSAYVMAKAREIKDGQFCLAQKTLDLVNFMGRWGVMQDRHIEWLKQTLAEARA